MSKLATPGQAALLLREYEDLNSDLPKETRRILGCFAIAHRVGHKALAELFDGDLRGTPYMHRAWFWYNCMKLAEISDDHWDVLADMKNRGESMQECLQILKSRIDRAQWKELGRRIGKKEKFFPGNYSHEKRGMVKSWWTKGGNWDTESHYTRILLFNEHLDDFRPREYFWKPWMEKLGKEGVRRLESEVAAVIDPDADVHPNCHHAAYEYVATRIPQLVTIKGLYQGRVGHFTVSWFFGTHVYHQGKWYSWRHYAYERTRKSKPRNIVSRDGTKGRRQAWEWF